MHISNSPEAKAQENFSYQNLSVVRRFFRRCCRRCRRRKHFTMYSSLSEPLDEYQPTWYKAYLGKGNTSLFK